MKKLFVKSKRSIFILFAFALVFSFVACSKNVADENSTAKSNSTTKETETETIETKSSSKSLVVYFSWSGNTEKVAKEIQSETGSDIFEIVPATPYSDDYNTVVDQAKKEQRNNARPEIKDNINNLNDYDTIYVGFPNWWGDMPMILYTFFDNYDLSGKTVALFCTSGGSGLSKTVNEVKELEPNATVTKGLHIGSSDASSPKSYVVDWLDEIGMIKK